jgi:outer membrane autotransporter protein
MSESDSLRASDRRNVAAHYRLRVTVVAFAAAMSTNAWAGSGGSGGSIGAGNLPFVGTGGTNGDAAQANGRNATLGGTGSAKGGGGGATDTTTGFGGSGGMGVVSNNPAVLPPASTGAAGAAGLSIVTGTISGGNGGDVPATTNTNGPGAGGGGVGVTTGTDLSVTSGASVTGGIGGTMSTGTFNTGIGGGGGGAGLFSSANVTVESGASITGGAGGAGQTSGGGGGGGVAVILGGSGTVTNAGNLIGGLGGNAKSATASSGQGGSGGEGVWISDGGTLINSFGGVIAGGAPASVNGSTFPTPTGGAGVVGTNATVINAGTITAGTNANAIQFIGGVNSLEIQAGSTINGNVVAFSTADTLKLGGATGSSFDVAAIGAGAQYQGFGLYQKTGTSTWTLSGTSTEAMSWTVQQGTLAVNGSIANSSFMVNSGGTLRGNGTVGATTLQAGGTIAPGNSIGTLLIAGNYTGNGGTLEIEGQFGGTGSPADRLLITGNATGTTTVKAINLGGVGAVTGSGNTDGISIVQVAGASAANTFQLAGGYIAAGPYQYRLAAFAPASSAASEVDPRLGAVPFYDYRLQSLADASGKPIAVPQIAGYQALPTGAVRYGASLLDSLHKRLGDLRRSDAVHNESGGQQNNAFFMRTQGSSNNVSGNQASGYDQDIWFVQTGGNVVGKDMEDGARLRIGGAFSYGESKLRVDNSSAKVKLEGTTLALTSTYQTAAGWYLDGVVQVTKYSSDINTSERGQTGSPNGLGYALSLEGGYPFDLGGDLIIEPQAQLSYQKIKFDRFTDVDNIAVDLRDGESLRGRFGGRIQKTFDANTTRAWAPYMEANVLHEFLADGSIRASDVSFASDSLGTSLQLGAGINAQVGANKFVFASVSYESGLSHAAADSWSGNVGMRIDF